jgi:excinuclease ABC subunit B
MVAHHMPMFVLPKGEIIRNDNFIRPLGEGGKAFELVSDYEAAGDQPQAIASLVQGIEDGKRDQTLLGVTGSGKTFTMAQVIAKTQRPALILAHNKTLAAQLYQEMRHFFPHNAVEYFVSYYDYYQPEAYVPRTDTYIEKTSTINEQIDRMRHSATRALLERSDVVVIASVSCIYGIAEVETYSKMILELHKGDEIDQKDVINQLVTLQYQRNDIAFTRGCFRVKGDVIEVFPSHMDGRAWRLDFFGDELDNIVEFDPLTGEVAMVLQEIRLYANSHYVTPKPTLDQAMITIKQELKDTIAYFDEQKYLLEEQRIRQRTIFDIEMLETTGICQGIENYSRHLTGRPAGAPPPTLFEYLPKDAIVFVDESHVTVSQIGAMYKGDFNRKTTLARFGFRLPSCIDNRPLTFEEWDKTRPQTIFVSATPGNFELERCHGEVIEQIVRPTGLIDPKTIIRPSEYQIDDVMKEAKETAERGYRTLITTLTKKMAENLTNYMIEAGLKVQYLHSDIDTLERIEIIHNLRQGEFDILIGINLLREGLDIPECGLVAILDADVEGFLRSRTSLIQTIGRAARNVDGRVILYADKITDSMDYALKETERRREKQHAYNIEHGITPQSVKAKMSDILNSVFDRGDNYTIKKERQYRHEKWAEISLRDYLKKLEKAMLQAAGDLNFEQAVLYRDELQRLQYEDMDQPLFHLDINADIAQACLKGW